MTEIREDVSPRKPEDPDGVIRAKKIAQGQMSPAGEPLNINTVNAWREGQGLPPVAKPGEKDKGLRKEISEERIDLSKISDREAREKAYRLDEERYARERVDRELVARRNEERRQRERMDREAAERKLVTNIKIDKTRETR